MSNIIESQDSHVQDETLKTVLQMRESFTTLIKMANDKKNVEDEFKRIVHDHFWKQHVKQARIINKLDKIERQCERLSRAYEWVNTMINDLVVVKHTGTDKENLGIKRPARFTKSRIEEHPQISTGVTGTADIYKTALNLKEYLEPRKIFIRFRENPKLISEPALYFTFQNKHKKRNKSRHNEVRRATIMESEYILGLVDQYLNQGNDNMGFLELNLPHSRSGHGLPKRCVIKLTRKELIDFQDKLRTNLLEAKKLIGDGEKK